MMRATFEIEGRITKAPATFLQGIQGKVIIVAPLAVAQQTIRESVKFGGYDIAYSSSGKPHSGKITITNYDQLDKFAPSDFDAIVLDESSILKSYTGKFRQRVIELWTLPSRLAASATPAPNDYMELGNHAEFVGSMTRTEMLSMFFNHDGAETSKWRLKGHAAPDFWKWVCSWAVNIRKPSDIGFADDGYDLPPIDVEQVTVDPNRPSSGFLFAMDAVTLQERQQSRRDSIPERVAAVADIVAKEPEEQWLIWCDLNTESEALAKAIPGAVEVRGSDSLEHKTSAMQDFQSGALRYLVTKPSIAGMGMNFQGCARMIFTGLSDSFELYYQAVRRCWRYGQNRPVRVYIVTARTEGAVVSNIKAKEQAAEKMASEMVRVMRDINIENVRGTTRTETAYKPQTKMQLPAFLKP